MSDKIKICDLFDKIPTHLRLFFEKRTYPWELIPDIKEYIARLLSSGIDGYEMTEDGILMGKDVTVSPLSTIVGPAIIGDGCEIRPGAYIRGNVIIGKGCVIGNSSEIKNSVLLDNATIPHYNYIGDSILGCYAHMGAGAIASNLKADKSNITVRGAHSYDTGLRKLGAIIGDHAEIGCGCILNPGTIIGKRSSVYPLTSVRGVIPEDTIVKGQNDIIKKR